jgi:aldehyde dehydrogenase (NAD+)
LGEVQEVIDICDFAVGLSRQLYGLTMHSERASHRMYEQYHPLGVVGIISAFNFPVAVWAWNAMLAWVCGNSCIWKPSEKTPLVAIASFKIVDKIFRENNLPNGLFCLVNGDKTLGNYLVEDANIQLVSATGSSQMGKEVGQKVASRFGKVLLELGGNNAIIVTENANLDLALRAIVFGAVGTCGQRCTTTRRLIVNQKVYNELKQKLTQVYSQLNIGNPFDSESHLGPLIDVKAVESYKNCITQFDANQILAGGKTLDGNYVQPTIIETENSHPMVQQETFAPILYLIKYEGDIREAIALQNDSKYGLSSSIFSDNLQETEIFLSNLGSDCGIANVNIGTSGAEIGGAFGGEKHTGGGRESGSDAWKSYMRRQTNTINYGKDLPLAQGIKFLENMKAKD